MGFLKPLLHPDGFCSPVMTFFPRKSKLQPGQFCRELRMLLMHACSVLTLDQDFCVDF